MNLFDSSGVYSIPFKEDSDGAADTTSDSDTALNLASAKHRSVAFTDTPAQRTPSVLQLSVLSLPTHHPNKGCLTSVPYIP